MNYSETPHATQGSNFEVENLEYDEILLADVFWRHRHPENREAITARNAVLHCYETGGIGATEAFAYLAEHGLFGDVEGFMRAYAAGIRFVTPSPRDPIAGVLEVPEGEEGVFGVLAEVRTRRTA